MVEDIEKDMSLVTLRDVNVTDAVNECMAQIISVVCSAKKGSNYKHNDDAKSTILALISVSLL